MTPHTWASRPQARLRGVEGCRGRGKPGGEVPREGGSGVQQFQGREWFRSQGGGLRKERCLLGWGGVGTEEGPGSPRLGHTAPAPSCSVCTPIAQGQRPPPPPQLDGSSFSASMAPRATCSAWDGRQLVLLTPSPRVARPAEGHRVGRPRRRRATTGFRLRATSWGNRDSSLRPHFPPHQSRICLASSASPPPSRAQGRVERSPREGWTVQSAVGPRARYSR